MLCDSLSILVAECNPTLAGAMSDALEHGGHRVLGVCPDTDSLLERCTKDQPDLVLADVSSPSGTALQAASTIVEQWKVPVLVTTSRHSPELLDQAKSARVQGYLVKPIRTEDLLASIEIAVERHLEMCSLQQETETLRKALDDRKVIERAKGILMKQAKLDEDEAFTRLRRAARNSQKKLAEVAQMIILSAETLQTA